MKQLEPPGPNLESQFCDMPCSNIVIIEDDPDIRSAIQTVLETEGYSVSSFENGKVALEGLKNCQRPCLILLDLMMPVMNGWEFLRARREIKDTIFPTPVFIVSAVADTHAAIEAQAKGYIKKPIDIDLLLNVVKKHCGSMDAHLPRAA